MGILIKEAFTTQKLAQILFLIFYQKLPHQLIIEYQKNNVGILVFVNSQQDKSCLGLKSVWTTVPLTKISLDNQSLGQSSLGQLLQHPVDTQVPNNSPSEQAIEEGGAEEPRNQAPEVAFLN